MKILFNCRCLNKGGAERVICTLANSLIRTNEVSIVTLINSSIDYKINPKIKVISVDKNKNKNKLFSKMKKLSLGRFISLKRIILQEKPDIIISFLPEPSIKLMIIKNMDKRINKIPVIVSIRNDPKIEYKNKLIDFIVKKLYKNVSFLILQTKDAMKYFEKSIPKDKMTIISNPINPEFMLDEPFLGIRDKKIVTVGRLTEQKNHKLLISSFKEIINKYPDYQLEIYGEGRLKNELQKFITDLKLDTKVKLMGSTDDVKRILYKSSMFILSSKYEGMPNALMEAMALGVPCISTNCPCGGPNALIKNNENGLLIENENKEELVASICKLIENKSLSKKISINACKDSKNYSIDKIVKKWENIINSTIKK